MAPTLLVPKFKDGCIVNEGVEVHDLARVKKETLIYVQPCAAERGKLMADIVLSGRKGPRQIDPLVLCFLLEVHRRRFAEFKCSSSLGVAKFKLRGRDFSVFKTGKIKIQRALTREEILRMTNSVSRLVWGAVACDLCGKPALECAALRCGECSTGESEVLELERLLGAKPLIEASSSLERARVLLKAQGPSEQVKELLHQAKYLALYFMAEAPDKRDASLGLVLLGKVNQLGKPS